MAGYFAAYDYETLVTQLMRKLLILLLLITPALGIAVTAEFEFGEQVSEQRYLAYISKIRCLMCQNESLSSSRADLAVDLRQEIYDMMLDGQTDQQISVFLVERYGDFILYQPPFKRSTLLLWLMPFIFLFGLITALIIRIKRLPPTITDTLSDTDREHARSILEQESQS